MPSLEQLAQQLQQGQVDELQLHSLEGGLYILQACCGERLSPLTDAYGQTLRLRSSTEVRALLRELPKVPCVLIQQVVHDEMCGQREHPVAPLRLPFGQDEPW